MTIIRRISKIQKLGIYDNFVWKGSLPDFKKYNLIYGWNGVGKTTLTKLFDSINTGNCGEFDSLKYSIKDDEDRDYSQNDDFTTPIRIFNSDFITRNVDFNTQSSKTISVVLGEESKELLEAIEADKYELTRITDEIADKKTEKSSKEITRDKLFTDIARTISQGTQHAIVRNYQRGQAKNAFKLLTVKELLTDEELEKTSKAISQEIMPKLAELSLGKIPEEFTSYTNTGEKLLNQTVVADVISRLKDNSDIASWVEQGLELHKKYKNDTCEFCGGQISENKIAKLAAHFNEADAKLKSDIDDLLNNLRKIYSRIQITQPADKMNLYKEFQDGYDAKRKDFEDEQNKLLVDIAEYAEIIKAKKSHTTDTDLRVKKIPQISTLSEIVESLNEIINSHNKKTDNFEKQQKVDNKRIETHYLSTIYDQVNELDGQIQQLGTTITELNDGIEDDESKVCKVVLEARIKTNKAKVSSSHRAKDILNKKLATFLGHNEIQFEVNPDKKSYQILRYDKPAKNLSDGERTAIAFIFFVVQLEDQNFDMKNGIIAIDDPVSSLDSNSQFQAFSFLKLATENASQLFLFTHNFEFLKLVLGWLKQLKKKSSIYMIKNSFSNNTGARSAYLDKMDESIEKFESEYHYLFNIIYKYKSDGTIERAYTIPNIARKLLDSFLMFRVPKNVGTYQRLQELNFDENKKSAIYNFANDLSHITGSGFDPSLVEETQKNVKYLLELMEETFPEHYRCLIESIS